MKILLKLFSVVFSAMLIFSLTACDDSSTEAEGMGTMKITVTDAPLHVDFVERANVTFDRIEVVKEDPNAVDRVLVVSNVDKTINLLELRNGVKEVLGEKEIENTNYSAVRLILRSAEVELVNGNVFDVDVPEDFIEVEANSTVAVRGGRTSEILVDFDLNNSFEVIGDPSDISLITDIIFDPSMRAANLQTTGTVKGKITNQDGDEVLNARIWLVTEGGHEVSTYSDNKGNYKLLGIPDDAYTVYCQKAGYIEESEEGVAVDARETTTVDFDLLEQ